mgnify:CR=1 FL=1
MEKAKEALVEIESGSIDLTADVEGNNGIEDLTFTGGVELTFDKMSLFLYQELGNYLVLWFYREISYWIKKMENQYLL